jgi:hypothetical protein
LFTLYLKVAKAAPTGTSVINLLHDASPQNQATDTAIFANDANLTELTLSPAPTNAPSDRVDGIFGVGTAVLASIAVTPVSPRVAAGLNEQFTAMGTYSDGTMADLTSQVLWASSHTGVASISNAGGHQGLARALKRGSTTIRATLDGVVGAATLTVTAAAKTTSAASAWATTGFTLDHQRISRTLSKRLPRLAAKGPATGGLAALTQHALAPALATAIDDWIAAGLTTAEAAKLQGVTAQINDLGVRRGIIPSTKATTDRSAAQLRDTRFTVDYQPETPTLGARSHSARSHRSDL